MSVHTHQKPAPPPEEAPPGPEVVSPQELARGLAALLAPAALLPFTLAAWRLGSDLGFAEQFHFTGGPLSSWIVWLLIAAAMQSAVVWLNKRGRGGGARD
jgi:hypothetical protein